MPTQTHPSVFVAATALNAVVIAGEKEQITLSPEDALALAPVLIEQTIQTMQLSGRKIPASKLRAFTDALTAVVAELETLSHVPAPSGGMIVRAGLPVHILPPRRSWIKTSRKALRRTAIPTKKKRPNRKSITNARPS